MGIYIELGSNLLQTFIITWFISNFFGYKYSGFIRHLGFVAVWLSVFAEISFFNSIIAYEGLLASISIATHILYAIIFLKGTFPLHIFLSIFAYSIIFTTSSILVFIGAALSGSTILEFILNPSSWRMFMLIVVRIVEYLIFRLVIKVNSEYTLTVREWILFVAMPLLSWVMLTVLTNAAIASEAILPFMLYAAIIMLAVNVIIYFFMFKIKQDSNTKLDYELLKMQYDNINRTETNMKALFDTVYSMKHDLDRHLFAIKEMADKNNCSDISSYITDIIDSNTGSVQKIVLTDNDIFNAVINTKLELCRQKNIAASISIDNDAVACIKNKYISVLFGNIFDNAIEAAEKAEPKVINFTVKLKRDYISIYIENSYSSEFSDTTLQTTKKNKCEHGFGIKNVRRIVEENNGMIQHFTNDSGMFCCDILLQK